MKILVVLTTAIALALAVSAVRADNNTTGSTMTVASVNPLWVQGVGGAVGPSFSSTSGAFTFCWGVTDLPEQDTFSAGPYADFSTGVPVLPGLPVTEIHTTTNTTNGTQEVIQSQTPASQAAANTTSLGGTGDLPSTKNHGCKVVRIAPGVYAIRVVATSWTAWSFVIESA
jgi:hypothetical protein